MTKIEFLIKKVIPDKQEKKILGPIRIIAVILSILLLLLIIGFIAFLLIPELVENIESLMNNIPRLIENGRDFAIGLLDKYPDLQKEMEGKAILFAICLPPMFIILFLIYFLEEGMSKYGKMV